jgi:hypothetical protein
MTKLHQPPPGTEGRRRRVDGRRDALGAGQDRLARQVHQDGGRIPAGGPTDTAARIVAQKLSDGSASRSSSKTSPAHRARSAPPALSAAPPTATTCRCSACRPCWRR